MVTSVYRLLHGRTPPPPAPTSAPAIVFGLALMAGVLTRRVDVDEIRDVRAMRVAVYLFVFTFAVPLAILAFGGPVALNGS